MGTGMVPSSPEDTAAAIAGSMAMAEAAEALELMEANGMGQGTPEGQPQGQAQGEGQPQPGQSPSQAQAEGQPQAEPTNSPSSIASNGGMAMGGDPEPTQLGPKKGDPELMPEPEGGDSRTPDSDEARDVDDRKLEEEPWFAKLPPELQRAIQAKGRTAAPRGYEERLRRYFESQD